MLLCDFDWIVSEPEDAVEEATTDTSTAEGEPYP